MTTVKEDRSPPITALDRSVEVVPLADPTNRRRRILQIVKLHHILLLSDLGQQKKSSVEHRAITSAGNQPIFAPLCLTDLSQNPSWLRGCATRSSGKSGCIALHLPSTNAFLAGKDEVAPSAFGPPAKARASSPPAARNSLPLPTIAMELGR